VHVLPKHFYSFSKCSGFIPFVLRLEESFAQLNSTKDIDEYIQKSIAKVEDVRERHQEVTRRIMRRLEQMRKQNQEVEEVEERQGAVLAGEGIPAQLISGI